MLHLTVIEHLLVPFELISWYAPAGKLSIVDQASVVPVCVCSKRCFISGPVVTNETLCAFGDDNVTTIATRPAVTELAAGEHSPFVTVNSNELVGA